MKKPLNVLTKIMDIISSISVIILLIIAFMYCNGIGIYEGEADAIKKYGIEEYKQYQQPKPTVKLVESKMLKKYYYCKDNDTYILIKDMTSVKDNLYYAVITSSFGNILSTQYLNCTYDNFSKKYIVMEDESPIFNKMYKIAFSIKSDKPYLDIIHLQYYENDNAIAPDEYNYN